MSDYNLQARMYMDAANDEKLRDIYNVQPGWNLEGTVAASDLAAFRQLHVWAKRIKFPNTKIEVHIRPQQDSLCAEITLLIMMDVPCRDHWQKTGQLNKIVRIATHKTIDAFFADNEEQFFQNVRGRIKELVFHEMDEMLLIDNERRYDPHEAQETRETIESIFRDL